MRSLSAAVSCLFSSSSFSVMMFCFSSVPRISCSFWYFTNFSCEVSTFICRSTSCLESQSEACIVDSKRALKLFST